MNSATLDKKHNHIFLSFFYFYFKTLLKRTNHKNTHPIKPPYVNVQKTIKLTKQLLPIIGISILLYLIYTMDVTKLKESLQNIPLSFLLLSFSLTIPNVIIRSKEWQLILREQQIFLPLLRVTKIFLIGFFYGVITPTYAGQLMRIPYLKTQTQQPTGKLFVNVIIEIMIHNISLYIMIIIGALLVINQIPNLAYASFLLIGLIIIILLYFLNQQRGQNTFSFLIKYLTPKKLHKLLNAFVGSFYQDFPSLPRLIIPFLLGLLTWIIVFTQEYLLAYNLNPALPYLAFILLFPIANAAGFLPITFAGLGTRELTSILLFTTLFDMAKEDVFVFTLLGFFVTDIFVGILGFLCTLHENHKRGDGLQTQIKDFEALLE